MKRIRLLLGLFVFVFLPLCRAEDWTVKDKTYRDVTVMNADADEVAIMYDGGIAHLKLADLTPDLQKKFGYDPAKAASPAPVEQAAAGNPGGPDQGDSFSSYISNPSYLVFAILAVIGVSILFRPPRYVIPLLCGVVLMARGIDGLSVDEQFTGNVVHVFGVVDELGVDHGRGGPHYYVNYHYSEGGAEVDAEYAPVTETQWSQLHVGDRVWVKYPPNSPKISRIDYGGEEPPYGRDNEELTVLGMVLICIGLYLLFKKYVAVQA